MQQYDTDELGSFWGPSAKDRHRARRKHRQRQQAQQGIANQKMALTRCMKLAKEAINQLKHCKKELLVYKNSLKDSYSKLGSSRTLHNKHVKTISNLQKKVRNADSRVSSYIKRASYLKSQLNSLRAGRKTLSARLNKAGSTTSKLRARLNKAGATTSKLRKRLNRSKATTNKLRARLNRSKATTSELRARLNRSRANITTSGHRHGRRYREELPPARRFNPYEELPPTFEDYDMYANEPGEYWQDINSDPTMDPQEAYWRSMMAGQSNPEAWGH